MSLSYDPKRKCFDHHSYYCRTCTERRDAGIRNACLILGLLGLYLHLAHLVALRGDS